MFWIDFVRACWVFNEDLETKLKIMEVFEICQSEYLLFNVIFDSKDLN